MSLRMLASRTLFGGFGPLEDISAISAMPFYTRLLFKYLAI